MNRKRTVKLTSRVMLILVLSFLCGLSCFVCLYKNRQNVYHLMKEAGIISFDEEKITKEVQQRAKNLNFWDYSGEEMMELLELEEYRDRYTGIYFYAGEDQMYQFGYFSDILDEKVLGVYVLGNIVNVGGEDLYIQEPFQMKIQFKDTDVTMLIYSYHIAIMIWPYMIISILLSMVVVLMPVLIFVQRRMRYAGRLKDEILVMSEGDLEHSVTVKGRDEIGILAWELDKMRVALDETIKNEQESRKSNHDLISAMSHDLRTPMTTLYGYLEILERKKCPQEKQEEYVRRCVEKVEEIRMLSDKMFEYALVYGQEEQAELSDIYTEELMEDLGRNGEYLELKGYQVEFDMECHGKVRGNHILFQRIFNNLFSNIMKYGKKEVKIQVKAERGNMQMILINDIKEDTEQVESNRIGLKSVRKMAEQQNGTFFAAREDKSFAVTMNFPLL